jgi:pilus assembly protein CpaB
LADSLTHTRRKSYLFLLTGLIIAGATALGAWKVLRDSQNELAEARKPLLTTEVILASRDLLPGDVVEEDDVEVRSLPQASLPNSKLYSAESEVVGKVVEERILAGEILRRERFDAASAMAKLEAMVPDGARAVTVKVDREGGLGGMLKPGVYVDLIVTIRPDENSMGADWVTETILQGVRVLGVGTTLQMEATEEQAEKETRRVNPPRDLYVTLEVEPDEAEEVAMASARGEIHLSLRSEGDLALMEHGKPLVTNALVGLGSNTSPARVKRLAERRAQKLATTPAVPPGTSAEVIQGGKSTELHFDAAGREIKDGGKR